MSKPVVQQNVGAWKIVGIVLLSYDYSNEKRGLIRSSAHVVEKQGKIGSGYRNE